MTLARRAAGPKARAGWTAVAILLGLSFSAAPAGGVPTTNDPAAPVVVDGHARFEVLSPTLIRLEYSSDGQFENRPTMVAVHRPLTTSFVTLVHRGVRIIRTPALTLRYREGSGPFSPHNLTVSARDGSWRAHPAWTGAGPKPLGGWVRALDHATGPVSLHPGLLSRAGWHLLNDTDDVFLTRHAPGFAVRRPSGTYQDGYFFGYGHDYAAALRDLRRLSGPTPLPPQKAFGVWFSRYWPYDTSAYHSLLAQFRRHRVPLDTLSVDTDWKREANAAASKIAGRVAGNPKAYSWNSWEWNRKLFPHPRRFLAWAHRQGLSVTLNIHPSIDSTDPAYPATVARSGPLATDSTCEYEEADPRGQCHVFDWANPRQLAAYLALHRPLLKQGVDFFWLDWCCDASQATAPGLTPDTWINSRYAALQHAAGSRWPVLSRVGGSYQGGDAAAGPGPGIFAEHRYTIQFTGDTCATWSVLAFEAGLSPAEASVGLPYVSNDIGSFNGHPIAGNCSGPPNGEAGAKDPPDLYARWVQLGTFQPLDRLHSNHGKRLPWQYSGAADRAATAALRLRETLVPYLYTLAHRSYETGLPLTQPLYLNWPHNAAAYHFSGETSLGHDLVVAPVTAPGNPARVRYWAPPGQWVDGFTGRRLHGPRVMRATEPLDRWPMLLRAGTVVVTQPLVPTTSSGPEHRLVATAYPGRRGHFVLYQDRGTGFGYRRGAYTTTRLSHRTRPGLDSLTIGASRGRFGRAPGRYRWEVRFFGVPRPGVVRVDGRSLPPGRWVYDRTTRTVTVRAGRLGTAHRHRIAIRPGARATAGTARSRTSPSIPTDTSLG